MPPPINKVSVITSILFHQLPHGIENMFLTPLDQFYKRHSKLFCFLLIALPVIGFNMMHVFGPKYLLHDDSYFYREGITNFFFESLWNNYGSLAAFTEGISFWTAAHISPFFVRMFFVIFYLNGISLGIYFISRRIFNLPSSSSYLAAVIPSILPMQHQIIAGINMSYPLIGTLLLMLSLITGFAYLTDKHHSFFLLCISGALFILSVGLMEQALILSASIGFLYLLITKNWKRKILIIFPVVTASSLILYRMLKYPRMGATPNDLSYDVIFHRIKTFLIYLSPFFKNYGIIFVIILMAIGFIGFFFQRTLRRRLTGLPHFAWLPETLQPAVLPLFSILWTIPLIVPFVSMTQYMPVRYLHTPGYGPWFFIAPGFILCLSMIFSFLTPRLRTCLITFCIFFTVVWSGIQHMTYAEQSYQSGNHYWQTIKQSLSDITFPPESDIVITNARIGVHSNYPSCSGQFARMFNNRLDIGGLIGEEFFYYDPFARVYFWGRPMTGLKYAENLYLYQWMPEKHADNIHQTGHLRPYHYYLRVLTHESPENSKGKINDWFLYKLQPNGRSSLIHSGNGLSAYQQLLEKLQNNGIRPDEICWGNPNKRFGVNSPEKRQPERRSKTS